MKLDSPALRKPRRVMLFVPGNDERKIQKALSLEVDAVILDLEDGVAHSQKEQARQTVKDTLKVVNKQNIRSSTEIWVRVNPDYTQQINDLSTIDINLSGYILPKAENTEKISKFTTMLSKEESRLDVQVGTIKIITIIESAAGLINLPQLIKSNHTHTIGYAFGTADYTSDIGAIRTPEGTETLYARSHVVAHAAAYGFQVIDTPYFDLTDEEGLRTEAAFGKQLGFTGKFAIHPKQINPIIEAFSPSKTEIADAHALIEAFNVHQREGKGAFAYKGQMVDMPMIRAARRILNQAGEDVD
jgi:citrate lyase beta subunit